MTINNLVSDYKLAKTKGDKKEVLRKIIKRHYSPIAEKQIILQTIVNKSVAKSESGFTYIDKLLLNINELFAICLLYTNIEIGNDSNNSFEEYDLIKQDGIYDELCGLIGNDINEVHNIINLLVDNYHSLHKSFDAFIINSLDFLSKKLQKVIENPELLKQYGIDELLNNVGDINLKSFK